MVLRLLHSLAASFFILIIILFINILSKYAKGDFTEAGSDLFGGKFKEELF